MVTLNHRGYTDDEDEIPRIDFDADYLSIWTNNLHGFNNPEGRTRP